MRFTFARMLACAFTLAAIAPHSLATHHLISPGQSWPPAAKNLRPGDEILLLPGEHRPALLQGIYGEEARPVVIRSADLKNPSVIRGGHVALQLSDCRHIVVRNVIISESTLCGLLIDDKQGDLVDQLLAPAVVSTTPNTALPQLSASADAAITGASAPDSDPLDHITIDSVTIRRIGPQGARHGMSIVGQQSVTVTGCTFEAWGGAAVEIMASRNVLVRQCALTGAPDHSQFDGIQVRGGSEAVRIEANTFTNAGVHAVRVGGRSKPEEFRPPLAEHSDAAGTETVFESARVTVMHNVILGSDCAVALSHARKCQVRNNTIIDPRQMVFAAAREHEQPRFGDLDACAILGNLITWRSGGSLSGLFLSTRPITRDQLALDVNLWWTDDCNERHGPLAQFPIEDHAEQLWEVDPLLDDQLQPRTDDAQLYGVPVDAPAKPPMRVANEGS